MAKKKPSVWRWPPLAKKVHFFVGGDMKSACNRWLFSGMEQRNQTLGDVPYKGDCVPFWKVAKKERDGV